MKFGKSILFGVVALGIMGAIWLGVGIHDLKKYGPIGQDGQVRNAEFVKTELAIKYGGGQINKFERSVDMRVYLPTPNEVPFIIKNWQKKLPDYQYSTSMNCNKHVEAFKLETAKYYAPRLTNGGEAPAVYLWGYDHHAVAMIYTTEGPVFFETVSPCKILKWNPKFRDEIVVVR